MVAHAGAEFEPVSERVGHAEREVNRIEFGVRVKYDPGTHFDGGLAISFPPAGQKQEKMDGQDDEVPFLKHAAAIVIHEKFTTIF
jgi:hypothetical protein